MVVVPPYRLSTEKARLVLPKHISLSDAIFNLQRIGLLVAAISQGDEEALQHALHDRLHEPYRQPLVPELQVLRKMLRGLPVLGCVLSGTGPSVLIIVHQRHKAEVMDYLQAWNAKTAGPVTRDSSHIQDVALTEGLYKILDLQVDDQGLIEMLEPRR